MATTVHLVRHAAHAGGEGIALGRMSGVGLSERGRTEASWIADRLSGERITAVVSSPRERAVETALEIADRHGCRADIDPALDEIDMGMWTGMSWSALADDPAWRRWNSWRSLSRPPGGEAVLDVQGRMAGVLERVGRAHPEGAVVLVSHAEPIRALLLHALGLGIDAWSRIAIDTASLSTLRVEGWGIRLERLNEAPR
jgi:broad specificity phosphatase PhoE